MPLLNYSTTIGAAKTVAEIQQNLAEHGAKAILIEYDGKGSIDALSFKVATPYGELPFRLPIHPAAVLNVLKQQSRLKKIPCRFINPGQANRIAWRIVKDWVAAQLAITETEMVRLEQVFLPYGITRNGQTIYEALVETKFKALTARSENKGESGAPV